MLNPVFDSDTGVHEACGVVGLWNVPEAAHVAALALHALQHRGQEAAGIAVCREGHIKRYKGMGLVSQVFGRDELAGLPGAAAVGHVRYSTAGGSRPANAQPLLGRTAGGEVALAHNGNLSRGDELANFLLREGALLQTSTDSELMLHFLARQKSLEPDAVARMLGQCGAAFSAALLTKDRLMAARDPWGFRPLALGRLNGGWMVASESCAFDQTGARFEREIEPGELICIDDTGVSSRFFVENRPVPARCLLELIYFARPDSRIFGHTPHIFRQMSGRALAKEHPADADIVVAVPDSGVSAAMGYAEALGVPLDRGIIRNHYVGRSFIAPGQAARNLAVRMKHNVVAEVVRGKRVALVDDSLIRGTTARAIDRELRESGAKEVHLRIACPPTLHPCVYGVDFPKHAELAAHGKNLEDVRLALEVDSLGYLSLQGMLDLFPPEDRSFCTACWNGDYRV